MGWLKGKMNTHLLEVVSIEPKLLYNPIHAFCGHMAFLGQLTRLPKPGVRSPKTAGKHFSGLPIQEPLLYSVCQPHLFQSAGSKWRCREHSQWNSRPKSGFLGRVMESHILHSGDKCNKQVHVVQQHPTIVHDFRQVLLVQIPSHGFLSKLPSAPGATGLHFFQIPEIRSTGATSDFCEISTYLKP